MLKIVDYVKRTNQSLRVKGRKGRQSREGWTSYVLPCANLFSETHMQSHGSHMITPGSLEAGISPCLTLKSPAGGTEVFRYPVLARVVSRGKKRSWNLNQEAVILCFD